MIESATELLRAFACSDLATIERLCAEDLLLIGTDTDETWEGRDLVTRSFAGAFDLDASWIGKPIARDNWVFGLALLTGPGGTSTPVRLTMVFRNRLLVHGHYSVAVEP